MRRDNMKEQELKAILQNADEQLAEQIASDYPTVDNSAKQRIFREIQKRKSISSSEIPRMENLPVPIRQKHRTPWLAYVGTAAALLLMVGGVMQIAGKMQRVQLEPNLPSPAQTVPITEMPTQNMTEEATPPETAPVELTKELLYSRCMATIRYLHQVSGHIEIWYSQFEDKSTADVKMDYDANRFYGITNQIEVSTGRCVSQDESFMSADRQVGFWDIKEWDFTYSDGAPGHSEKSKGARYEQGAGDIDRGNTTYDWAGLLHPYAQFYSPQDTTRGYLSDQNAWEITDREVYQGRDCAVIEGTSKDYGKKFKVTHFQIKIDIATGVWMLFEGYDDEGTCQWYLHTQDVVFDDSTMQVPDITEEEIDRRIADGYVLGEQDAKYRQAHLEALARATEQPTEGTTAYVQPFVIPETMPQPFADGTEPESDWYRPCYDRFDAIPEELSALVSEEDMETWRKSYPDLKETSVTSLGEYANKYSFIRDFGLTEEQVRTAMKDYICAWDGEISLREDEMNAIISGNEAAMLYDFALESSMSGTIIVGTHFYTPKWIYEHDIEDYKAAGITPEMLQNNRKHWYFHLTEEAQKALDAKINQYTGSYPQ